MKNKVSNEEIKLIEDKYERVNLKNNKKCLRKGNRIGKYRNHQ